MRQVNQIAEGNRSGGRGVSKESSESRQVDITDASDSHEDLRSGGVTADVRHLGRIDSQPHNMRIFGNAKLLDRNRDGFLPSASLLPPSAQQAE